MLFQHKLVNNLIIIVFTLFFVSTLTSGWINIANVEHPASPGHNLAWDRHPIEGFAWPPSVKPGDTVKFYTSVMGVFDSAHQSYQIEVFRLPNPNNTNPVWTSGTIQGHFYPLRDSTGYSINPGDTLHKPVDYKVGCKAYWSPTAVSKFIPPSDTNWKSGLYYARFNHLSLSDTNPRKYFYTPFVVRAANPATSTNKILFKFDFNTYIAYSYFGGGSLYSQDQDGLSLDTTDDIATDRPILQWEPGVRLTFFDYKNNYDVFLSTLDSLGYQMDYCNNIDIDADTNLTFLSHYKMLVIFWHDEYWSANERDVVEKFKGDHQSHLHGNIARFAPNTCYWRIKWPNRSTGDYTKMYCNKWREDSVTHWINNDLWRNANHNGPNNPEAKLLGEQFNSSATIDYYTPPDTVRKADHWIFTGTGLGNNSAFGYGYLEGTKHIGIVAGELEDTITSNPDFPYDVLSRSLVYGNDNGTLTNVYKQMVYYEDTLSNARVLAEGANGWVAGLSPNADNSADRERMKKITDNIFSHFSWKKFAGKVWTTGPTNALEWNNNVEIDGDANILQNKYLKVSSSTVTIDSNVSMYVNGSMEVNGSIYIGGNGTVYVNPTGKIILKPNAVLTMDTPLFLEAGGDVQFGYNSRLVLLDAFVESTAVLSVDSGGVLVIQEGGSMAFGTNAALTVYKGKLLGLGSSAHHIAFKNKVSGHYWQGITFTGGGPDTLTYCTITNAGTGVSFYNTEGNSYLYYDSIRNCTYDGIYAINTSTDNVLSIQKCVINNNSNRGLNINSITVEMKQTSITHNGYGEGGAGYDGIYLSTAILYMDSSRIEYNSRYGVYIASDGVAYFTWYYSPSGYAKGYNTFYHNGGGELYVTENGWAFLGEEVNYDYCDCGPIDDTKGGLIHPYAVPHCDEGCEYVEGTRYDGGITICMIR